MTEILSETDAPSDAELISRVRGGDLAAYGDLFARHVSAARRLARQLVRGPDSEDLVSDAFAKTLSVVQQGGGPDVAFRAYLLTAVRRLHVDRVRAGSRLQSSDDMTPFDPGVPFRDTAVDAFESGAAARAFGSLPERWQMVLWHLEVEGQKPAEVATLLGMSPNSVSALAYRAREGLRQAFLTMHLTDIPEAECRWVNEHLGGFVRKGLARRDNLKVRSHLDQCRRCTGTYLELTEVNSNLAGILAPVLLGGAAAGYLASAGGTAGGLTLAAGIAGRVRDVVIANAASSSAAGAVAAGVAGAVATGAILVPGADVPRRTLADPTPLASVAPAVPGPTSSPPLRGFPATAPATLPGSGSGLAEGPDAGFTDMASPVVLVAVPTEAPSATLTAVPSAALTETPTATLIETPTPGLPTESPVESPTVVESPTETPAATPTDVPTDAPTDPPTDTPTDTPTETPTDPATEAPTDPPSDPVIDPPTDPPTDPPIEPPTDQPIEPSPDQPIDEPVDEPVDVVLPGASPTLP